MININILIWFGLLAIGYLLGSIPSGFWFTRCFGSVDIRRNGSGNIGATNVNRIAGTWPAILTLIADILKGALPVFLAVIMASQTGDDNKLYPSLVALSAIAGHMFPIFLKFKEGGKGVATAAGCFSVLSPLACIMAGVTFIIVVYITNRVSVGSLCAAVILPISVWATTPFPPMVVIALITSVLVCLRHKENIHRLLSGTEPVFRRKNDDP